MLFKTFVGERACHVLTMAARLLLPLSHVLVNIIGTSITSIAYYSLHHLSMHA